jgi:O-antigen/teichoic acid export membrane protein
VAVKSSGPSIASDSVQVLAFKVLVYAVGFGASVLVARVLGPSGRGAYYFPVVAAATLVVACGLGLEQANVYLRGSRGIGVGRLWAQAGLVSLAAGLTGLAALLAGPFVLPGLFSGTRTTWLWLAGLTIPLALHTQLAAGLLTLLGRVTWQFRVGLVAAVSQAVLLAALYAGGWLDVTGVLVAGLVSAALSWLLMTWPLARTNPTALAWDGALLGETLRHALPLHTATLMLFLHLRLDMFMVRAWLGDSPLGHYSLAVMLAETVLLATDSLAVALLPRQIVNTVEESAALALRGARANALVALAFGAAWAAAGWPFIGRVFGWDFAPAFLPLVLLLPGMVFIGMQRACGGPALRSGRPWRVAAIQAASLAVNATLNTVWIPRFGPAGAAVASSVSYALGTACFLLWTARMAGTSLTAALPGAADVRAVWRGAFAVLAPEWLRKRAPQQGA